MRPKLAWQLPPVCRASHTCPRHIKHHQKDHTWSLFELKELAGPPLHLNFAIFATKLPLTDFLLQRALGEWRSKSPSLVEQKEFELTETES
jgi:hypothetical protein